MLLSIRVLLLKCAVFLSVFSLPAIGKAQQSAGPLADTVGPSAKEMDSYLNAVAKKAFSVEEKIDRSARKYLFKIFCQENKLKKKIGKKDSALAKELFEGIEEKYAALNAAPQQLSRTAAVYNGHLDSLATALRFLKSGRMANSPELQNTVAALSSLQNKLNKTEAVKKFIAERSRLLNQNLEQLEMLKYLNGFQKQAYYYSAQLRDYKAMWEEPERLEKRLMEEVVKLPQFKEFFQKNSMLGSLFSLPASPNGGVASLAGLQTRASVQASLIQRFGTGANVQQLLQGNMQAAQSQLSELKNKLGRLSGGSYGNSNSDLELPDGFKPNTQKTKTFLQRLEYGANIQSQKANNYFPVTSDIGLSLGYKLNDKGSIGIGGSYKLGLGRGWNNIRMSSEGVGLRSYVDYKLKGSIYISGGYEQNYHSAFSTIQQLQNYSAWQTSGLVGLSKKYKVSKNLKCDIKLLWDFLSYQQVPRTQAVLFRIGYSLK